ncbi:MAG: aminodeoxychorismate synthase component I, partial [Elusimicrobiota bacterium]|nr:aminodeoxychorismate synthase component I [Elusimicrobiota bacterium]
MRKESSGPAVTINEETESDFLFVFEPAKKDSAQPRGYCFVNPIEVLTLKDPENIDEFFDRLEKYSRDYYLAGYFSYELGCALEEVLLGYCFEERLAAFARSVFPFAQFGVFKERYVNDIFSGKKTEYRLKPADASYRIKDMKLDISRGRYIENVNKIKKYILKGDIYQANYTARYNFSFSGSELALYLNLKECQQGLYNCYCKSGGRHILSLSPELFFEKTGSTIMVKPMKGTAGRGVKSVEDRKIKESLAADEKNRSENLMIVDLLRNDLSKISQRGSVKVEKLYEIEKYPTLFQMTSTVKSRLSGGTGIRQIIESLFPSGSVTGAPKIRAMEIINELEETPRNIYCGAMGYFEPGGNAKFNVAIRTATIESGRGVFPAGGGIVNDSDPDGEFEELKLKARFLTRPVNEFKLVETILYDGRCRFLKEHLERMEDSAEYFNFSFNGKKTFKQIKKICSGPEKGRYKVRVLGSRAGRVSIAAEKVGIKESEYKLTLSAKNTDS